MEETDINITLIRAIQELYKVTIIRIKMGYRIIK